MKNLILVGLVAFVSWQAFAGSTPADCTKKSAGSMAKKDSWDYILENKAKSVPVKGVATSGGQATDANPNPVRR